MARLVHPTVGTVVHVGEDLERAYRAAGWTDVKSVEQPKASSEKPVQKSGQGRPKKN